MGNPARLKKLSVVIAVAIIFVILAVLLRGPQVSNALKKMVLPELEAATGQKVIAQKMYINIFPLFVEAKDLKVFDESGQKLLLIRRLKAYVGLSGIMRKTLTIQRLVVKEPVIQADEEQMKAIRKSVQEYLSKKREDAFSVKIKAVEVQNGVLDMRSSDRKTSLSLNGLTGEAIINDTQRIRADVKMLKILREGYPEVTAGASAQVLLKGDTVTLQRADIDVLGSRISGSGDYAQGRAVIRSAGDILVKSIKRLFGLTKSGEGSITFSGVIQHAQEDTTLDLSLGGSFYLETLMELLDVKETLQGLVEFKGQIKGPLQDISAEGVATLTKGNLYDVLIESVSSKVLYRKGTLRFVNGDGSLYRGRAKASASLTLPSVDHFTLDIAFTGADSRPLFKLIGWDPGVPDGKVNGELHHAGAEFNPKGNFEYAAMQQGKDLLGRVKGLSGAYDLEGDLLTVKDLRINTEKTEAAAEGIIDIKKETLDLQGRLRTPDVTDLTLPYYGRLGGECVFSGKIQGTFQNPVIIGKATLADAVIEGYPAGTVTGDFSYRKDLLEIQEVRADTQKGTHRLSGSISFKDAKELFDLSHPLYHLRASLKHADIERFVKIFYADFAGTGTFSSNLTIEGRGASPDVRADVSVDKAVLYAVPLDSAFFDFTYSRSRLEFRRITVKRGESVIQGDAAIYPDDTFSYRVTSGKVRLSDIIQRPLQGEVVLSLSSEGRGSFGNPSITLDARMTEGTLRGKPVGKGIITASLQGREFNGRAKIVNDRISISAKGRTDGVMPWEVTADIQTGRYDFLITSVLKDVPEDLILSLHGHLRLHGTRDSVEGAAAIKHMVLSLYGHTFTNEEEIVIALKERELSTGKIAMRSGNTLLRTGGSITIGRNYNVTVEGSSALSPFKSLSARLGVLKGDAEFVVGITGPWDKPEVNGSITLSNGAIALKEYPAYRITELAGYLYIDNDKVVLQSLSGKLGGGDIGLSGVLYLKKFSFSRFYVEARLNNITTSLSREFTLSFGGNLLYKGTPASHMLSGDIDIYRAGYRERIDWKSWLLQTKRTERYKSEISNLEKAELNIKVTSKDSIIIDNNIGRAVAGADMVLKGTMYRPVLFGRIESREGTVFFRNNEFRILHASADFADPNRLNPFFSIAAETSVKNYKIRLNLDGQLEHFNMSLSSDPPLKEMDVLALLTVGQRGGEVKGLSGGIGAGEATSFVTGKLQDVVEERMRSITGLDRIQIDPHISKKTSTVEPRVTVSKRLLSDKLYISYSTPVSSNEEQIVKIEYYVGKNVSLVGLRDERGIVGGDIRFRFEFK